MIRFIKRLIKNKSNRYNKQNNTRSSSFEKKRNPYMLLWYKQGWSEKQIAMNNDKYWAWEIENNGFNPQ